MLLEVKGLAVSYGAICALDNVSFTVDKGQIVTIIGANGAGKSTIMNAVSGLVKPSAGLIRFKGAEITGLRAHEIVRRGIVQVPEGRGIFGNLTVLENLEVAASGRADKAGRAQAFDHVFELFPRLAQRRRQHGGTLSGGEQQMLAIGRGLITHGEILLLDEPSMGLAPTLVEDIFGIIRRINAEGVTILLVEQNALMALETAHTAYVLESGKIALSGLASSLMNDPRVREMYLGHAV
jgi:branched-chain amino acid transport system ATP-binding protein